MISATHNIHAGVLGLLSVVQKKDILGAQGSCFFFSLISIIHPSQSIEKRIFLPPDILLPTHSCDHSPWNCPRHPRLKPNPLRPSQSSPAHSWRCDSFQWTSTSPSTRPVPPTVTQSPHHTTVPQQSRSPFRLHQVPPHPHYHYVSLRSASG